MRILPKYSVSFLFFLGILLPSFEARTQTEAYHYAVRLSAQLSETPGPRVSLSWLADANASSYTVSRKMKRDTEWETLAELGGDKDSFTDSSVSAGTGYEYQVLKKAANGTRKYIGTGYIYAGIKVLPAEESPRVLLVIDSTMATPLGQEISRLKTDLNLEGWQVVTRYCSRAESFDTSKVKAVKKIISDEFKAAPGLKTVFLLGRVPVPYSGDICPDGHCDTARGFHKGAWPADVYYADMDEKFWRDKVVNNPGSDRPANRNIPGDGKFDTGTIPSDLELMVGRVDMYNMPAFEKSEIELLRQYLNKDHNFRTGQTVVQRRGLIDDDHFRAMTYSQGNVFRAEAFSASGWKNFSALLGKDKVEGKDWFTTLDTASYLFSYGCGQGSDNSCNGVGVTKNFADKPVQSVFTFLFGSYFGDWNVQNNLLRASLASSPTVLTCAWAGRPHWYLHHMGLGEPIGYSALISQNNNSSEDKGLYNTMPYFDQNYPEGTWYDPSSRGIHVALMGDPTLTMEPRHVKPPGLIRQAILSSPAGSGPSVGKFTWQSSPDTALAGYFIYRSVNGGPVTRLNSMPQADTSFMDQGLTVGDEIIYHVRAAKLISGASGSYYVESLAQTDSVLIVPSSVEENSSSLVAEIMPNPAASQVAIFVTKGNSSLEILDLSGRKLFTADVQAAGSIIWNLSDEAGARVPAGIYLVKISNGARTEVRKIIVMP